MRFCETNPNYLIVKTGDNILRWSWMQRKAMNITIGFVWDGNDIEASRPTRCDHGDPPSLKLWRTRRRTSGVVAQMASSGSVGLRGIWWRVGLGQLRRAGQFQRPADQRPASGCHRPECRRDTDVLPSPYHLPLSVAGKGAGDMRVEKSVGLSAEFCERQIEQRVLALSTLRATEPVVSDSLFRAKVSDFAGTHKIEVVGPVGLEPTTKGL